MRTKIRIRQFGIILTVFTVIFAAAVSNFQKASADVNYAFKQPLTGSGAVTSGQLGRCASGTLTPRCLAGSENYLVVGSPFDDTNGTDAGLVYVYKKAADSSWSEQQKIVASDVAAGDRFGTSVAINGTTITVGSMFDDVNGATDAGSVYTFDLVDNSWQQTQKIISSSPTNYAKFGFAVDINENKLVIGEPGANGATGATSLGRGAVTAYDRNGINWVNARSVNYTSPFNATTLASFGFSLSLNGDKLAVGAPRESNPTGSGAVSVMTIGSSQITQSAFLRQSTPTTSYFFGSDVDYVGGMIIASSQAGSNFKAVSIFSQNPQTQSWSEIVVPVTGVSENDVGASVAFNHDATIAAVGSRDSSSRGAIYILERDQSGWRQTQYITTPTTGGSTSITQFGFNVAIVGNQLFATEAARSNGVVSVFEPGDGIAPTISYQTIPSGPTTNAPYVIRMTASEPISGFDISDLVPLNGTVSNFVSTSPNVYEVTFTPNAQVITRISIPDGAFQDTAGNGNVATTSPNVRYDTIRPTSSVTSTSPATRNAPISFTVQVTDGSNSVNAFTQNDVIVTGGSITSFSLTGDTRSQTAIVAVQPSGEGDVSVHIPNDVTTDAAGNGNMASAVRTVRYDTVAPTPTLATNTNPTNQSVIPVTLEFNEVLATEVQAEQLDIAGATIENFTVVESKKRYSFDMNATSQVGTATIRYAASQIADPAGNQNVASNDLSVSYDSIGPTVMINALSGNITNENPLRFKVTFNKDVTGLTASDFSVTNGSVTALRSISASEYDIDVRPAEEGDVSVLLQAGSAIDSLGNLSQVSNTVTSKYDDTPIGVSITTTNRTPTNEPRLTFDITITETPARDLVQSDISAINSAIHSFTRIDSKTYRVVVDPIADGDSGISLNANSVQDAAGNGNTLRTRTVRYDSTAPSGTVHSLRSSDLSPALSGTFDDPNATIKVTVNEQTITAQTSGLTWSIRENQINDLTDGVYDVSLEITDEAGNVGSDTTIDELTIDTTAPTTTITRTSPSPTNQSQLSFGVEFSKPVTGLTIDDFTISGATGALLTKITDDRYEITATATSSSGSVVLPSERVQDELGNGNRLSNISTFTYDTSSPSITFTGDMVAAADGATVVLNSSEDIDNDLAISDLQVNGSANIDSVTRTSPRRWTITVTSNVSEDVTVSIDSGVLFDAAGNGNTADAYDITFDLIAPNEPTVDESTTTSKTPVLEGRFDDSDTRTISVLVGGRTFNKTIGLGTGPLSTNGDRWTLDISQSTFELVYGVYDVAVITTDAAGNRSTDMTTNELTINQPSIISGTVDKQITAEPRPELTGTVTRNDAAVSVRVENRSYNAVNNRDGSWTLAKNTVSALNDGIYDVQVTFTAPSAVGADSTTNELTIDSAAPRGTFTRIVTESSSPRLSGTVDTPTTEVSVELLGKTYEPKVDSDSSWVLPAGTISPKLQKGTYLAVMTLSNANTSTEARQTVRAAIVVTESTTPNNPDPNDSAIAPGDKDTPRGENPTNDERSSDSESADETSATQVVPDTEFETSEDSEIKDDTSDSVATPVQPVVNGVNEAGDKDEPSLLESLAKPATIAVAAMTSAVLIAMFVRRSHDNERGK